MFDFLKAKSARQEPRASISPVSSAPNSTQQRNNLRRELIRVVLKDTLRLHGIPFDWLACEVIIAQGLNEEELRIQLVVLKWKEQLLRYAPALQQQLLLGLDRFDPSVDHSKYIISWRFSPDCGCPFTRLPAPNFWRKNTVAQVQEESVSVLDRRHFRRTANSVQTNSEPTHAKESTGDFSPTHVSPLR
jgi:hypothetical protein